MEEMSQSPLYLHWGGGQCLVPEQDVTDVQCLDQSQAGTKVLGHCFHEDNSNRLTWNSAVSAQYNYVVAENLNLLAVHVTF